MQVLFKGLIVSAILLMLTTFGYANNDTPEQAKKLSPCTCSSDASNQDKKMPSNEAPETVTEGTTGNTSSKTAPVPVGLQ